MSFFLILIAFVIGISSLGSVIIIFGSIPNLQGTILHRWKSNLVQAFYHLESNYDRLSETYFHGQLTKYINWLIPAFYLFVITFCVHGFFDKTYSILPNGVTGSTGHYLYMRFTVLLVYVSFAFATFADPGTVSAENSGIINSHFRNNSLIFFDDKVCDTCRLVKPARSKHCSICNKCVFLFDHHCIWVNNCLGYYNYRWFMLYLVANINLLVYGGYLCARSLQSVKPETVSYWVLITSRNPTYKITGIFVILCTIFTVITSIFTTLHLRYIYLGVTTNESDKWGEVEHLIGLGVLFKIRNHPSGETFAERAMIDHKGAFETVYISLRDARILFNDYDETIYCLEKVRSMETDMDNIYDKGFWANLGERLFPRQLD